MKKILHLLIIIISIQSVYAEGNESLRDKQKNFVKKLYHEKKYFDCISEARRLQTGNGTPGLNYFIYMNYYLAEQYRTVISLYTPDAGSMEICGNSLLSMSYFKLGMYEQSYKSISGTGYSGSDREKLDLFIRKTGPLILSGDMERLRDEELSAEIYLKDDYNFTMLRGELARFRDAGLKSPVKGSVMSAVVPGLGQLYSGYPAEGLISFASVVTTALGSLYLHREGMEGYSCTLLFFSGLFHAGNIYGAYNSAERRNRSTLEKEYRTVSSYSGEYDPSSCIKMDEALN